MNYWICRKCKSENTPNSAICWKCSVPQHANQDSFNEKMKENFHKKNDSNRNEKTKPSWSNSNYWVCNKCNEQIFYLAQFCPTCFAQRPEKESEIFRPKADKIYNEPSENTKLICICSSCNMKLRILYSPGKHEMQCPGCRQEFDVFIMNDRSVHLVKRATVRENVKAKLNWFEVLEIDPDSSREEIKAAYRKLMKEYHPDKVAMLGKDLKALAESKTKEISEAYETAIKMIN